MKDKKTLLEKIKEILFSEKVETSEVTPEETPEETEVVEALEETEAKFVDVSTEAGVIIRVDGEAVAVGAVVGWVLEDGSTEPVENGEFILSDGQTLVVVDSVITEVRPVEAPTEEAPEAPAVEEVPMEEIAAPTAELLEKVKSLEIIIRKLNENFESLETKFEAFAGAPAEKKIEIRKDGFKEVRKVYTDKRQERLDLVQKVLQDK
jgi:hypothetical protein